MVTVSVIVPVYNAEKYLKQTLLSIQNQTFRDFEVLLVDDGSTDQSGQICDEWSRKDNRFKVIHQQNHGVAAARNAGIRAAQGEFIAFLDADDLWLPEKLKRQITFMKEKGCNLSYTAYRFIDENGNILNNINCYTIGSDVKVKEVKAVAGCRVERDSSGRFISISIPNDDGSGTFSTYALTTTTVTDQDAYNDAMNEYEHEKYLYDQAIDQINAKIEIIQAQDKNLELRLQQLDTEQNAIQTEMDSVEKVIEKNVEGSFKTFG